MIETELLLVSHSNIQFINQMEIIVTKMTNKTIVYV